MPGRGEAIYAMYVGKLREGLDDAMEFLADQTQAALNTAYPPPSSPGESPHRRTGHLQRNVDAHEAELHGAWLVGAVGVNIDTVSYAGHLEFGTSKMSARPYLRPSLHNNAEAIRQVIVRKI